MSVGIVVVMLFLVDCAHRVFHGVGLLLLAVAHLAPAMPAATRNEDGSK